MRYHFSKGVQKDKKAPKKLLTFLALGSVISGAYLLVVTLAPMLQTAPVVGDINPEATKEKLLAAQPGQFGDRLYIPQINIDVAIVTGDEKALEQGAWHRKPDNGDPQKGGNFVLSAHRFLLGWTPEETRAKSPFYHIDKLAEGDQFFVDFQGKRYAYQVEKKYQVERTATEIESQSADAKLTLYSCDIRGEKAGREVIEAKPIGTVANNKIELNRQN